MRIKRYAPPRFLAVQKSEDSKIATGSSAAHICGRGGIGRLDGFRCCHLSERWTVVDTSIEKIGIGLQKYCSIMTSLYQTDVSKDREFQRLFNGYYRMRQRSERFYCCFYRYLEEHKFDNLHMRKFWLICFKKQAVFMPLFPASCWQRFDRRCRYGISMCFPIWVWRPRIILVNLVFREFLTLIKKSVIGIRLPRPNQRLRYLILISLI